MTIHPAPTEPFRMRVRAVQGFQLANGTIVTRGAQYTARDEEHAELQAAIHVGKAELIEAPEESNAAAE